MFTQSTNGSKVTFAALVKKLVEWEFSLIDCQITNPHLQRLGSYKISHKEFLRQ